MKQGLGLLAIVGTLAMATGLLQFRRGASDGRSRLRGGARSGMSPTRGPRTNAAPSPPAPASPLAPESVPVRLRHATWFVVLPGAQVAGYAGDTGLDLASPPAPVFALADGALEYSEPGHTVWTSRGDTPNSVRLRLDRPVRVAANGRPLADDETPANDARMVTHVYYTHMSSLRFHVREGLDAEQHVAGGTWLGRSGVGNGLPHLHLGLLTEGETSQTSWRFILREDQVRRALGGYRPGERLAQSAPPAACAPQNENTGNPAARTTPG